MKIDLTQKLTQPNKVEYENGDLKTILIGILEAATGTGNSIMVYKLSMKIAEGGTIDITADELVFLREVVTNASRTETLRINDFIIGQTLELLDSVDKEIS